MDVSCALFRYVLRCRTGQGGVGGVGSIGGGIPGAGHGLHNNVSGLDAGGEEFLACALEEWPDDLLVPARVQDADAQV